MLSRLKVKGFLLIDNLELDFNSGLTVITGETGSGKSIIIEALLILFGAKTSSIRDINQVANFEAQFELTRVITKEWLLQRDLQDTHNDSSLICRRLIDSSGKSKYYINGYAVTQNQIKSLGELILDIHTQNTAISLLNTTIQRNLLDSYANINNLVKDIHNNYLAISAISDKIHLINEQNQNVQNEIDHLRLKLEALESLSLADGEWQRIQDEHKRQHNISSISDALNEANEALFNTNTGAHKLISRQVAKLTQIHSFLPQLDNVLEILASIEVELDEVYSQIDELANSLDEDPKLLDDLDKRITEVFDISRKYKLDPEDICEAIKQSKARLIELDADVDINALKQQLEQLHVTYDELAKKISQARTAAGVKLTASITELLHKLFISGEFHINLLSHTEIKSYGRDEVEFMVSFNKGLEAKPLSKAASGGELSRVALSLYLTLSLYSDSEVIIFDEIDVGVGGQVASAIGKMLHELGQIKQVISITHHAQSASFGDWHLAVHKITEELVTLSKVQYLDDDARILEIARMLSSTSMTDITLQHAKEMLSLTSKKVKSK